MSSSDPNPAASSAGERHIRVQLAACYRLVDLYGWSDLCSTHISARIPGDEQTFLINPHGMLFDEIRASDLQKVDMEGRPVGGTGYGVNLAGFVIHSAIHMAHSSAMFVLHTHTSAGVSVATQQQGLLPLTQHALAMLGDVAYHDFEGPALDTDERGRIVADLGDRRILVLRNHGLLTVGATAAEAFMAMYRMERACRMQLAVQQSHAPTIPVSHETCAKAMERGRRAFWNGGAMDPDRIEWPALLRKLDRIDPSYRE